MKNDSSFDIRTPTQIKCIVYVRERNSNLLELPLVQLGLGWTWRRTKGKKKIVEKKKNRFLSGLRQNTSFWSNLIVIFQSWIDQDIKINRTIEKVSFSSSPERGQDVLLVSVLLCEFVGPLAGSTRRELTANVRGRVKTAQKHNGGNIAEMLQRKRKHPFPQTFSL